MSTNNSPRAMEMYLQAKTLFSIQEIADRIGINTGTITRWEILNRIPAAYMGDFSRMLGLAEYGETAQDKDQYYTKASIAMHCYKALTLCLDKLPQDYSNHTFIEPSAGDGSFYKLLPEARRIGVDLDPNHVELISSDYLLWQPENSKNNIVFGNPPFGLRGHLALQFINHSHKFSDIVAFILPPTFNSTGRGNAAKRVKGYTLMHTEILPKNSFEYPDKTEVDVTCMFQVWIKDTLFTVKAKKEKTCNSFIKVYSLTDGGSPGSSRNIKMIGKCDIYLPSTCFRGMRSYNVFTDLPNQRGYGLVVLKDKKDILKLIKHADWEKESFISTNGATNLRLDIINRVITKGGYYDT